MPRKPKRSEDIRNLIKKNSLNFIIGLIVVISAIGSGIGLITYQLISRNNKPVIQTKKNTTPPLKIYTVNEGDSLWTIAETNYGSGYNAIDIIKANKLQDPNNLIKGQKLLIPIVTPLFPTRGEINGDENNQTNQVTSNQEVYLVQPGDYYWKIAEMMYGDGNLMNKIMEANNITDPNYINPGMILKIPR
ncbi:hypothetical protein AUK04_04270 [Candidatus Roizmanbacteria bacterium CG2_30_33_16]|uniref:LysM domain-containing protein n=4 Tax=Candidatus Roizmaniibacteriota TaxID=1752723 RepID=A0A2H0C3P4_9BACT|nr:MAG: hypothetical protein AUK04_04270 [Candidatus Roizmanbacteria bacterium CG2_30_33_16]PIP64421.1 MAG: hypothetical protein COW96_02610 [Candidatus Roizmanbacteria bacterium CG22_combo_CG10-13_8_21_14_all_33_16]PJB87680.1 MAG: hypothetical protein CO083_05770 [Candidatus Roizmanbacteria bacterium CG_4_9_14_0_8_um_filter_34_12]